VSRWVRVEHQWKGEFAKVPKEARTSILMDLDSAPDGYRWEPRNGSLWCVPTGENPPPLSHWERVNADVIKLIEASNKPRP